MVKSRSFPLQCGCENLDSRAYYLLHWELSPRQFARQHKMETSPNGLTSLQVVKKNKFQSISVPKTQISSAADVSP